MDKARSTAFETLNRCFKSGAWSALTLDSLINGRALDRRDAAFATWLTYGVIRNYALLDFWIDRHCSRLDLKVRNILRMGAYQLKLSDRIPESAAVNESVQLAKDGGCRSAAGLVNAVLRKIAAEETVMPEELSVRYSQPDWFIKKMTALRGEAFTRALLEANNTEAEIVKRTAFAEGEYYVQDPAAYRAVEMLGPKPGMRVLDCCSAPGGKSFTAGVLMQNTGEIVSCDIHANKLGLVSENAKRLGIDIIRTVCADASVFNPEFSEAFDAVIADVPCSGFGVMRKKPEIRFKLESEIAGLPAIQRKILNNVSAYVKPGGRLLYATCTVFPEENEEISHSLEGFALEQEKSFWPNLDRTDGFYAAVLVKES